MCSDLWSPPWHLVPNNHTAQRRAQKVTSPEVSAYRVRGRTETAERHRNQSEHLERACRGIWSNVCTPHFTGRQPAAVSVPSRANHGWWIDLGFWSWGAFSGVHRWLHQRMKPQALSDAHVWDFKEKRMRRLLWGWSSFTNKLLDGICSCSLSFPVETALY